MANKGKGCILAGHLAQWLEYPQVCRIGLDSTRGTVSKHRSAVLTSFNNRQHEWDQAHTTWPLGKWRWGWVGKEPKEQAEQENKFTSVSWVWAICRRFSQEITRQLTLTYRLIYFFVVGCSLFSSGIPQDWTPIISTYRCCIGCSHTVVVRVCVCEWVRFSKKV